MKYREMNQQQKDFCKSVLNNLYNSKARKVHTKRQAAKVIASAFKSQFGEWPLISGSTIDTLIERARNEDGMVIVSEPSGKGMICTYGRGKNEDPAIVDHVASISAAQQRMASTARNVRLYQLIPFTTEMLPAANLQQGQQKTLLAIVENGNQKIATEIVKNQKVAQVKYKTVQIPYYEDENGNEIQLNQ